MLDLRHRGCWPADPAGHVGHSPTPLLAGEWIDVTIEFEATTWTLVPGHTLRLAVAGSDWPNCWPPPGPLSLELDVAQLELTLPLVVLPDSTHALAPGGQPSDDEADGVVWRVEHDVLDRETRVITRYGGTYGGLHSAIISDDYRGELGVSTVDPAAAWARGTSSFRIEWPDATVRTEASLCVTSNSESFDVTIALQAFDGETQVADRTWHTIVQR
jgi:uncharacterized protein